MSEAAALQTQTAKPAQSSSSGLLPQHKCACGGSGGFAGECSECRSKKLLGKPLQTKLRINEPGDEYEQEADRVADQVMRMADPAAKTETAKTATPRMQRMVTSTTAGLETAPSIVRDVLASPGEQLDTTTRAFFEPRFGHDFSQVRVHADAIAAKSTHAVNAKAYTVGNHVVFGQVKLASDTRGAKEILAHELVHTIQQQHALFSHGLAQTIYRAPAETTAAPTALTHSFWLFGETVIAKVSEELPPENARSVLRSELPREFHSEPLRGRASWRKVEVEDRGWTFWIKRPEPTDAHDYVYFDDQTYEQIVKHVMGQSETEHSRSSRILFNDEFRREFGEAGINASVSEESAPENSRIVAMEDYTSIFSLHGKELGRPAWQKYKLEELGWTFWIRSGEIRADEWTYEGVDLLRRPSRYRKRMGQIEVEMREQAERTGHNDGPYVVRYRRFSSRHRRDFRWRQCRSVRSGRGLAECRYFGRSNAADSRRRIHLGKDGSKGREARYSGHR